MKRHYILTTPKDVDVFIEDIEKALDNTRIETVNQATHNASRYATWVTPRRLPSRGGGSYGQRHNTRIHHDAVGTMGLSVGEAYNDHQWAQAVEFGTESHEIRAKNPLGMRIEQVLPIRGGGKGLPPTPPYGTKYVRTTPGKKMGSAIAMYVVQHPGGRSFLIYTAAFDRLVGMLGSIMRKAFKQNW